MGGDGVPSRGGLCVATPIRLSVHIRRHPVWLLSAVSNTGYGAASHGHRLVTASTVPRNASSSTALGTSVRSLVDTDLPAVKPGYSYENCTGASTNRVVMRNDLLNVVHRRHGFLGILLVGVSHEAKASASAGVAILDNDLNKLPLGSCRQSETLLVRHASGRRFGDKTGARGGTRSIRRERTASIPLHPPLRIPRTSVAMSPLLCAMQGHCKDVSCPFPWPTRTWRFLPDKQLGHLGRCY